MSDGRWIDLIDPAGNVLLNQSPSQAAKAVRDGDINGIAGINGQFAICQQAEDKLRFARTIARPMRYYQASGRGQNCLIVAERIDEIYCQLARLGMAAQFVPSATRMVPAHHLVEVDLPLLGATGGDTAAEAPRMERFLVPPQERWPADISLIGSRYVGRLMAACQAWLEGLDPKQPIGVLFSGGVDSGSVLIVLAHLLKEAGEDIGRLTPFTLAVDDSGEDVAQARQFLQQTGIELDLEVMQVPLSAVDYRDAIGVIEDYKPLDVQSATMALAMCRAIRAKYPEWQYLIDGDGGDENLKDYPLEDHQSLSMQDVLGNRLLYQEGWGIDALKHSQTYSGGQSRGHVRTWAPARRYGFQGFSPYALPTVIEAAEQIPFVELTEWNPELLYSLKGKVVAAGVREWTGVEMPRFEKRRFQRGAVAASTFDSLFPANAQTYRDTFATRFSTEALAKTVCP